MWLGPNLRLIGAPWVAELDVGGILHLGVAELDVGAVFFATTIGNSIIIPQS